MSRSDWFARRQVHSSRRNRRSHKLARKAARPKRHAFQFEPLEDRLVLSANVYTDMADYQPGATAHVFASDFAVGETVAFQVLHNDGTPNTGNGHNPWLVTDGVRGDFNNDGVMDGDLDGIADGNIHTTWYVNPDDSDGSSFDLTAQGLSSGAAAFTTFTDGNPAVNLEQWENLTNLWKNGQANTNQANYLEGQIVPYWLEAANLTVGTTYGVRINLDYYQSNTDAGGFVYLDTYNETIVGVPQNPSDGTGGPLPALSSDSTFTFTDPLYANPGLTFTVYNANVLSVTYSTSANGLTRFADVQFTAIAANENDGEATANIYWGQKLALPNEVITSANPDANSNGAAGFTGGSLQTKIEGSGAAGTTWITPSNAVQLMPGVVVQPGRIIVEKQTNPDGSVETFEFDPSYGPNFNLADDGTNNSGLLTPGSYTVQELAEAGWDLTNIQIVSGDTDNGSTIGADSDFDAGDTTATIDLDAGEVITVRFTNTQRGRIIVEKQTNPDGSVETFEFDPSYGNNFSLSDGQTNNSGFLTPGSYTVEELAKAGWDLTNIQIVSGDTDNGSTIGADSDFDAGDTTATIDLDAGEVITVRFTNTEKPCVIIICPDKGKDSVPLIKILDQETGDVITQFYAYETSFRGGVRIATGDLTGDGIDEIITAPGQGRVGEVRVFTQDGIELTQFRTLAYGGSYMGGIEVAVGDVNGDGKNDIVTTPSNGRTEVRVFYNNYDTGQPLLDPIPNTPSKQFFVYSSSFLGGADVIVADMGTFLNGATVNATTPDGKSEIIVGNGPGMRSTIFVYDVTGAPAVVDTILPFSNSFKGGITLSAARVNADSIPDLIVASGNQGGSAVEIWDGLTNDIPDLRLSTFTTFANTSTKNAPVHATALDITGDEIADLIAVVQGTNGTSNQIRYFTPGGAPLSVFNGFTGPWNIASSCDMNPMQNNNLNALAAKDQAFWQLEDNASVTDKKAKKAAKHKKH